MTPSMAAARVRRWGRCEIERVDVPSPGPDDAVVRVTAAAVGHIDAAIISGDFFRRPELPFTPGVEGAGVVESSSRYQPGTVVWVRGGGLGTSRDGTWAERIAVPHEALGVVPAGVPAEVVAGFFSPCVSAATALEDIGDVGSARAVAVSGAAGAVGRVACQLAALAGRTVIGIVSSAASAARATACDAVLVDSDAEHADLGALGEVDLVVDTVGGARLRRLLPHIAPGGRVVLVGSTAGSEVTLSLADAIQRDVSLLPLNLVRRMPEARRHADHALELLAAGRLDLPITTVPFAGVDRAVDALTGAVGRVVVKIA